MIWSSSVSSVSPAIRPWLLLASFALLGPVLAACSKKGEDLPEWTPADHDNQAKPSPGQVDTSAPKSAPMSALAAQGIDEVVLAAWKQNCVPCHGTIGRGDGPQGALVQAADLTKPAWQASITDEQMAATIRQGRGKMPGFPALPDATLAGIVRLIRMMNAEPQAPPSVPAAPTPTPGPG